jgi:glycosyltransferase involved in cell wall biosynthesis
MLVSVLICTRNHASSLRDTLQSLAQVHVPETLACELIIVDNGSTDDTAAVVRSSVLPQMPVRYLTEPRPGKGHAYNTGLAAAQGDIFLFTDDDVRLPRQWIEGLCAPLLGGRADIVAGGVTIAPHLERPGMQAGHRTWLASTEGLKGDSPQWIVGANMAFARAVLAKIPGFDPELGPSALGFEDEVLFYRQALRAGFRAEAVLEVVVEHHFDESRLRRAHFLEMARKTGCSQAYVEYHWKHRTIARPRWELLKCWLRLVRWRLRHGRPARDHDIPPWDELALLNDVYFHRQYLSERRRPRLYDPFGLVKRGLGRKE